MGISRFKSLFACTLHSPLVHRKKNGSALPRTQKTNVVNAGTIQIHTIRAVIGDSPWLSWTPKIPFSTGHRQSLQSNWRGNRAVRWVAIPMNRVEPALLGKELTETLNRKQSFFSSLVGIHPVLTTLEQ